MKVKKTFGEHVFDVSNILFLSLLMLLCIYPIFYIVCASFSEAGKLLVHQGALLKPLGFSLKAYEAVLQNEYIIIGYRNTLFYVTVGTMFSIFMTSLGAFVLSRKTFFWKKYFMTLVVITMFFNGGLIPTYLLIRNLQMLNTWMAIVIPAAIGTWNLLILKTAFQNIPVSLEEAAKIDGANDIFILFRIIMPLALPTIAVLILYYGVGYWNSWFSAMIYLNQSRNLFPLQLFLREILITNTMSNMLYETDMQEREAISETIKYATIIVATVPILFSYPFLQKHFVKGVMVGSIKG